MTAASSLGPSPFQRLPVGRPVDRFDYVTGCCRGLRVLDLGAFDETEVDRPGPHRRWLHAEIAAVAAEVLGVDSSIRLASSGGTTTASGTRIVHGSVDQLESIVAGFRPDVIVAGELIEHTPDTLGWLGKLAAQCPGVRLVATTPNATSLINLVLALLSRENCHPDHIQVYSFRTLRTLADRIPMERVAIHPYYYDPHLFFGKVPKLVSPVITAINAGLLRPAQYLFPLTSFGLVLDGVLTQA